MKKIKLLSFDLDDTLWLSKPVIQRAEQVFYSYLTTIAPALVERFSPESLRAHRLDFLKRHPKFAHQISQWRIASLTEALELCGYKEKSANIAREAFAHFIAARQQVTLFPYCENVIRELSQNYMLISLTNGNADLNQQPVGQYFHANFQAEHVNAAKPEPALFLKALDIAGCKPEEAIHIGDHIVDDISGAKALGFFTIQACLKPDSPEPHALSDEQFNDWRELPSKIEQLEQILP
ncbi:HAD family hydrolase [Zhongshania aliphaticivorans]|uniref:HAD family hydrolase n=1 Tax=Zhongshania aliphaticivorans TaxID=1470434 RepID=UPI0012E55AFE|nr:HAD family hydrolase [Zhongshania aliphaticivorans]CAA0118190.1 5-amino-6-(5-phospho-D-ribitylamino)uracil phosphatase YigB [Zhongshania aliphaticivorans]